MTGPAPCWAGCRAWPSGGRRCAPGPSRRTSSLVAPLDPASWALLVFGALGVSLYAAALQRGSVTMATACQYALDTWFRRGRPGRAGRPRPQRLAGVAAVGFLLTLGAAIALTLQSRPPVQFGEAGCGVDPGADAGLRWRARRLAGLRRRARASTAALRAMSTTAAATTALAGPSMACTRSCMRVKPSTPATSGSDTSRKGSAPRRSPAWKALCRIRKPRAITNPRA